MILYIIFSATEIKGRYGSSYKNKGGTYFTAKSFFTHEKYNIGGTDYDIGLVELYHPINFTTPQIKKIALAGPTFQELTELDSGVLTGWGTMSVSNNKTFFLFSLNIFTRVYL